VWASKPRRFQIPGITRDNILRLIENSLLVPVFTPMNNRSEWKFDRAVLQDFFAKIISQIIPLSFLSSLELPDLRQRVASHESAALELCSGDTQFC